MKVQLNPTNGSASKGPTVFICYRKISVIANIERDLKVASIIGGFPLLVGPLERDKTVYITETVRSDLSKKYLKKIYTHLS